MYDRPSIYAVCMNKEEIPARLWQEPTAAEIESVEKKDVHKDFADMGIESKGLMPLSLHFLLTVRNMTRLVYTVFPECMGLVKCIKFTNGSGGKCIFSRSNLNKGSFEIHLSRSFYNGPPKIYHIIRLKRIFAHEMGHAVSFYKRIDCGKLKRSVLRELGLPLRNFWAVRDNFPHYNFFHDGLRPKEFVAEAFAEYMTSIQPCPIALLVGRAMKES